MAFKLAELELTEAIRPVSLESGYSHCQLLLRYKQHPVGWIYIHSSEAVAGILSTEKITEAVKRQTGTRLVNQAFLATQQAHYRQQSDWEPISIVVCTRNRTQYLSQCLPALLALNYPAFEVIVVDNAPSNDATFQLASKFPVRYVREDRPGLDWARNRGIREAQYQWVAFTDDDAKVDPHWLQAIARNFANPEVMAVTGFVAPAELETHAQFLFEFDYGGMGHGFRKRVIRRDGMDDIGLLWASNFGVGVNMAFRREVFSQIGLFDTALDVGTPTHGGGDVEMLHRLVAAGNTLVYEPGMIVWHTHRHYTNGLRKQIFDNGRGFGSYLLTCGRRKTVKRSSVLEFFLSKWLYGWIFRNLVRPPGKLPRYYAVIELAGMLTSPFAYRASHKKARMIAATSGKSKQALEALTLES